MSTLATMQISAKSIFSASAISPMETSASRLERIVFSRRRGSMASVTSSRAERMADHLASSVSALDRKSTRLNPVTNAHLVCRLLLENKNRTNKNTHTTNSLDETYTREPLTNTD